MYQDNSMTRSNAIGGLLQNQPIVGGGFNLGFGGALQDYKILGQPDTSFQMLDPRDTPSSVVIDQTKLYVTGGRAKKSTEILSLDQSPVKGPELPFTVQAHSMVQIDPKTIYLTGGAQDGMVSNKTWIIDPMNNFDIRSGPALNEARYHHLCNLTHVS